MQKLQKMQKFVRSRFIFVTFDGDYYDRTHENVRKHMTNRRLCACFEARQF